MLLVKKYWKHGLVLGVILVLSSAAFTYIDHLRDKRFDAAQAIKLAEIDTLTMQAQALQDETSRLRSEVAQLTTQLNASTARLTALSKSKTNAETKLSQDLAAVRRPMPILDRCRAACERAKSLGLISQDTDCQCK